MMLVGYGYFHPTNQSSQMFTVFYALVGILLVISELNIFAQNVVIKLQNKFLDTLQVQQRTKVRKLISFRLCL